MINIPFIILLFLNTLGLGMAMADHGKPRSAQNAWTSLIAWVLQIGLVIWSIYWGGFA